MKKFYNLVARLDANKSVQLHRLAGLPEIQI